MKFIQRLYAMQKTRVVGFGSSNTECCYNHAYVPGWLNWMDFGLRKIFGRTFSVINSGVSGQTSAHLVQRFEDDVALYKPHLVFITIGGNDASPGSGLSAGQFRDNLITLIEGCRNIPDCEVVLQTYYSPILEAWPAAQAERFIQLMDVIRQTAREQRAFLFDHFPHWRRLKARMGAAYAPELMDDALHLNALGNQLWACNILSRLAGGEMEKIDKYFLPVMPYQKILTEAGTTDAS
jgi:lysophospholipase L1-like esterase